MPSFNLDDELSTIATPVADAIKTNAQPPQPATPSLIASHSESDDDAVDLIADHRSLRAQSMLSSVLPKEAGKTVRFALIKDAPAYVKATHYLANAGPKGMTVVCPGEGCPECALGGEHTARRKVVALAVKYETAADGKFSAGTSKPELSIGFVNLSPTAYTEMSDCPSEGENLYNIDFRATKKTNGIGWTFGRMSSPAAHNKAGLEAEVTELAKPYMDGKVLKSRLGKVVSVGELKLMMRPIRPDTSPNMEALYDLN